MIVTPISLTQNFHGFEGDGTLRFRIADEAGNYFEGFLDVHFQFSPGASFGHDNPAGLVGSPGEEGLPVGVP